MNALAGQGHNTKMFAISETKKKKNLRKEHVDGSIKSGCET